jgi:transposase-like protein
MSDLQAEKRKRRGFSREFKLSALARMSETESIVSLAHELGLERKLLYCWREKLQTGGPENLRGAGRPRGSCAADRGARDEPEMAMDGREPMTVEFAPHPVR